jgi:hypothetical protein
MIELDWPTIWAELENTEFVTPELHIPYAGTSIIEPVREKIQQLVEAQLEAQGQPYDKELETVGRKAANSGSRTDLREYLKLRRERNK